MDQLQILKGFVILTIVVQVTTQHFPSQHPFQSRLHFDDDHRNSNTKPTVHFLRRERQITLPKSNGNTATSSEITFDSYNMAFPAQLQPFWSNMKWPIQMTPFLTQQQQQQKLADDADQQLNGYRNENDGFLYSSVNDAINSKTVLQNDGKSQNLQRNAKKVLMLKPSEKLLFWLLLNDANKQHRRLCSFRLSQPSKDWQTLNTEQTTEQRENWPYYERDNCREPEPWKTLQQQINGDKYRKRNAFRSFKRQKSRSLEAPRFIPSISAGTLTNLGHFFKDLKNNVHFIENQKLGPDEEKLLGGDHPINMLRDNLIQHSEDDAGTTSGTAAFLHAIRTYRPSQKIRSLVAMNPEGYHGSQFLDPNYIWLGLGK